MTAPAVQTLETIAGGVSTPKGFRAAGVSAGIKAKPGALDLALLVSDRPATAAAVSAYFGRSFSEPSINLVSRATCSGVTPGTPETSIGFDGSHGRGQVTVAATEVSVAATAVPSAACE